VPPTRTLLLSRLTRLYCRLVGLSMMSHQQLTVEGVTALLRNPSLTLLPGSVTLAGSLATVRARNRSLEWPPGADYFSLGSFTISSSGSTTQLFQSLSAVS
jgi:hypothetical protein